VEERLTNEEYKIWKKNTPFLYGVLPWGFHLAVTQDNGVSPRRSCGDTRA
jgi:hypothetical protein